MALPIGSTPVLKGEEATKFIAMIHEDAKIPAKLTPTPKLEKARKLIKEYARDEQKLVC
ncbi:hypothetical protein ES703_18027 [subsurface metagenome]